MNTVSAPQDIGKTTISQQVLHKIARLTTLSVQGVSRMASSKGALGYLHSQEEFQGVKVRINDEQVFVDIYVILMSGMNVRDIARDIQSRVSRAISEMIGMVVGGVNIHIMDVDFNT